MDLSGKAALVTGASRGIGRAIAIEFARAGADVAVHFKENLVAAREVAAQVEKIGRKAILLPADLANPTEAEGIVIKAAEHFGRLDILVNNAGIVKRSTATGISEAGWAETFAVNVHAAYIAAKAAAPYMQRQGAGKIVNIASLRAVRPTLTTIDYSASKAALVNLTRGLALALAPSIQVNAVSPSYTKTDMAKSTAPERAKEIGEAVPLKRWAEPEDVARVVLFFVSPASNYVTGQHLVVDGGLSLTTK